LGALFADFEYVSSRRLWLSKRQHLWLRGLALSGLRRLEWWWHKTFL
jgi:hypothetical protein